MRHALLSLTLTLIALFSTAAQAFEIEDHRWFGPKDGDVLRVISTTDTTILTPLIEVFLQDNPGVGLDYVVASSGDVMKAVSEEGRQYDVALSSAMDLQVKLANDGFTRAHQSAATDLLPEWGEWREHVFAFSQEPASIVVSANALNAEEVPRTRQALISLLRDQPDRFRGKIGTYDVAQSGLGYLFATQDARTAETYWRLMELMGGLGVKLYCCSGDMIESVAEERILVAYNVLGSYARARKDLAEHIVVIDPQDYTHLMMRSAVILNKGENADMAGRFVDHLIRAAWSTPRPQEYPFSDLSRDFTLQSDAQRPINLDPGLLVYLDRAKRKRFLEEWQNAVRQK